MSKYFVYKVISLTDGKEVAGLQWRPPAWTIVGTLGITGLSNDFTLSYQNLEIFFLLRIT